MNPFKAYAFSTSSWMTLESLPLLLAPRLIVSLAASEPRLISDLETYLCRTLGFALLAFSILVLLLAGAVPFTGNSVHFIDTENEPKNPYLKPTLVITTVYHALTAFYLYTQLTYSWNFAFTAGCVGSTALFCFGLWTLMFGSDKARLSRRTGADKRTSNFPFSNSESARAKKKEDKRERKDEKERERESKEGKEKRRSMARTKSRDQ